MGNEDRIDFSKISFQSYIPLFDKYLDMYAKDKTITEYVSFAKWDCSFIFYDNDLAGFYKIQIRDYDLNDREIYIALIPKYRNKGIAEYVVNTLANNIFKNDFSCQIIHMSIDKSNTPSINLAKRCGFEENKALEGELRNDGDDRTLIFSIKNKYYVSKENTTEFIHKNR